MKTVRFRCNNNGRNVRETDVALEHLFAVKFEIHLQLPLVPQLLPILLAKT